MPDVWIAATAPFDAATWRDAVRLLLPVEAVLCGVSALAEHGMEVRAPAEVAVHVSTGAKLRRRVPEVVTHRLVLQPDEVMVLGRWQVTTPQRTAFDCVRWAVESTAVATASAIVDAGLCDADDLASFAERHPRIRGASQARLVADIIGRSAAA
jgi:predicted transcriptional regulator of viral defense system